MWNRVDHEDDSDDFTPLVSGRIANEVENNRKSANFDLRQELLDFQLATQVIYPGKTIHGVIGVKSQQELMDLKVSLHDVDFSIQSFSNVKQ